MADSHHPSVPQVRRAGPTRFARCTQPAYLQSTRDRHVGRLANGESTGIVCKSSRAVEGEARLRQAGEQPRRELARADPTARTEAAGLQVAALGATVPSHWHLQHLQRLPLSHHRQPASSLSGRGVRCMALLCTAQEWMAVSGFARPAFAVIVEPRWSGA